MKKVVALLAFVGFVAGIVIVSNNNAFSAWGKGEDKEAKTEETKAKSTQPKPKLIYTFKDKDEMAEFEELYVSKQATYGRMGVLQAYFTMEQNNLAQIDKRMEEKFGFKLDPTKMYDLNRDTMQIKEVGPVQSTPAPAPKK